MGVVQRKGAIGRPRVRSVGMARNAIFQTLALLLISNPEGGLHSSSSISVCMAEEISRTAHSRLADPSPSRGGAGLLPALGKGLKKKKKHVSPSQDGSSRGRKSHSSQILLEDEMLGEDSSHYGEDDESIVDVIEREMYGPKPGRNAASVDVLKPPSSGGRRKRQGGTGDVGQSEDGEDGEEEDLSGSSGAGDKMKRKQHVSGRTLRRGAPRGDTASLWGGRRGNSHAERRDHEEPGPEEYEEEEEEEVEEEVDNDNDEKEQEGDGSGSASESTAADDGGDADHDDHDIGLGGSGIAGKGGRSSGEARRKDGKGRESSQARRGKGRGGENIRVKDFRSVKHLREDEGDSQRENEDAFSISVASSIDSEDQGSSILREDSSSKAGSFQEDLADSSVSAASGVSADDSCNGESEDLIKAIEERAHRAATLPVGMGDALYSNLTQADEDVDPLYYPEGMVQQRKPGEAAREAAVGKGLLSGSTALMLDEAGKLGEKFANDFAIINNVPFRKDEDGPAGAMIESQKAEVMQRFLYGGMITGDKNRDLLQEMLNLPPPAAKKPQATAAAIKPGVSGGGASRKGGFVQDALPEGLMLAEGPAQTGGRISESEGAIVPAGLAGGGLVPFDEEGAGGDEEEEPDLTGMRDDVPEDALDAQPGVMQPFLDERENELVMIQREFVTTSSTNASYVHRKLHPAVVPRWALEKFGVEAYGGVLGRREKSVGEMMLETDGHGNTVKALMLCGDRQVSLNVPLSDKQLAIVARREAEANKIPENVSKILQWAKEMSTVDAKQFVELHKPEVRKLAATSLKGASRAIHLVQEAARKVGMPKARKGRLSMSHAGTREAVERGEAIPKNTRIPLNILRGIRGSLKKKYKKAKERAREMDMDITPELVKARDALRYSAGTRNDVIAKGAVFGRTAELMEMRKREDRARGKRRRGPDGLMNRPS